MAAAGGFFKLKKFSHWWPATTLNIHDAQHECKRLQDTIIILTLGWHPVLLHTTFFAGQHSLAADFRDLGSQEQKITSSLHVAQGMFAWK